MSVRGSPTGVIVERRRQTKVRSSGWWTCGPKESASQLSISSRIRACSPAPDAPRCDVLPRVSITRYPTISPKSPTGSNSEPQTDPRSDRRRFPCRVSASCTPDISNAASARRASPMNASGTRGGGRSDRAGLLRCGCHPLAGRSDVVGHQLPARASEIRDRDSSRRADELPGPVACASWSASLPVPLLGPRGRKRARTPSA